MRLRVALLAAGLALLPAPAARASVSVLVLDGRGHGHGVGMAQDGAYWMARGGADLAGILGHFYPGAGFGSATGPVRVVVHVDDDADEVLTFPGGGELRSPLSGPQHAGFPVRVGPGAAVRVRFDGAYRVSGAGEVSARSAVQPLPLPTSTTTTSSSTSTSTTSTTSPVVPGPGRPAPPPPPGAPPAGAPEQASPEPVWAVPNGDGTVGAPVRQAVYRGVVEATAAAGPLRLVNQLDVEQYLRGMGEVRDPTWPPAALQAQAVVARTYALRAMAANGEICDTQRCQVYLGQQAEYGAMDRAVEATRGRVVVYRGRLAAAVYSASGGGVSATPQEGFAQPDEAHPYLVARPYETPDPRPYQVRIGLADLGRRLGYPGDLTDVRVARAGPSGRALVVELDGSAGVRPVSPLELGRAAGARSTLWALRVEQAETAPEPPPALEGEEATPAQALPDDVGSVLAREARPRDVRPLEKAPAPEGDLDLWAVGLLAVVALGAVEALRGLHAKRPAPEGRPPAVGGEADA